ncbi:MAG: LuxR C-terminal-related transcriptional regulator [Verrucomicrobiota bacterium]
MPGLDLKAFSAACVALYAPGLQTGNFAERGFTFLRRLVSAEFSGCGTLQHRTGDLDIGFDTEHPGFATAMEAYGAVMGGYDIYRFDPTVNAGQPFRRSQFFSNRQFRDLDIYREVYQPLGIDNHCALHVPTGPDETLFFFLERRGGPDYSDGELALLTLAQDQLANAHAHCRLKQTQADHPVDTALLTDNGLTPREAETLSWLAEGKTNHEIALLLGIGLHTVKAHVASVFNKTGVGNRHAAIIWARDVCRRQADAPIGTGPGFVRVPTTPPFPA